MTDDEALALIRAAVDNVSAGAGAAITMETDLIGDDILDSLDVMNFLFRLEKEMGSKIEGIDEEFSDFKVATIMDLMKR